MTETRPLECRNFCEPVSRAHPASAQELLTLSLSPGLQRHPTHSWEMTDRFLDLQRWLRRWSDLFRIYAHEDQTLAHALKMSLSWLSFMAKTQDSRDLHSCLDKHIHIILSYFVSHIPFKLIIFVKSLNHFFFLDLPYSGWIAFHEKSLSASHYPASRLSRCRNELYESSLSNWTKRKSAQLMISSSQNPTGGGGWSVQSLKVLSETRTCSSQLE